MPARHMENAGYKYFLAYQLAQRVKDAADAKARQVTP